MAGPVYKKWALDEADGSRIMCPNYGLIAVVVSSPDVAVSAGEIAAQEKEHKAIARLIAAAPEMLAALRLALPVLACAAESSAREATKAFNASVAALESAACDAEF